MMWSQGEVWRLVCIAGHNDVCWVRWGEVEKFIPLWGYKDNNYFIIFYMKYRK